MDPDQKLQELLRAARQEIPIQSRVTVKAKSPNSDDVPIVERNTSLILIDDAIEWIARGFESGFNTGRMTELDAVARFTNARRAG